MRRLELWQTEWCPASQRVRQRLTELGVNYLVHQVPVERADRRQLLDVTGVDTIPVLADGGEIVVGEEPILRWLGEHVAETPETTAHRLKAAKARRRQLEEECECTQPATP
jgi:glutathione S-transferase